MDSDPIADIGVHRVRNKQVMNKVFGISQSAVRCHQVMSLQFLSGSRKVTLCLLILVGVISQTAIPAEQPREILPFSNETGLKLQDAENSDVLTLPIPPLDFSFGDQLLGSPYSRLNSRDEREIREDSESRMVAPVQQTSFAFAEEPEIASDSQAGRKRGGGVTILNSSRPPGTSEVPTPTDAGRVQERAPAGSLPSAQLALRASTATQETPVGPVTAPVPPATPAPDRSVPPPVTPETGAAVTNPVVTPSPVESDASAQLTSEVIISRRVAAEQRTDLSDELKTQISTAYQRALESLNTRAETEKRRISLKAEMDAGPEVIRDLRAQLERPASKAEPEYSANMPVTELERLRLADEERLTEARNAFTLWETKAKTRAERRPQMPALIEGVRRQLEEMELQRKAAPPEGENPALTQARSTEQEAAVLLLRSQQELYRIEQLRYDALNDLFPLQRDVLMRNRSHYEKISERWKEIMSAARFRESEQQKEEARRKLEHAHPALKMKAEFNAELTERRREHQVDLNRWKEELSELSEKTRDIREKFDDVLAKEKRVGLTTGIGLTMRNLRSHLPDPAVYRRRRQSVEEQIVRIQAEQILLEDARKQLVEPETIIRTMMAELEAAEEPVEFLQSMALDLLNDQRRYTDELLRDLNTGLDVLAETDVGCKSLETLIQSLQAHIDERVLWIRSAPSVGFDFPSRTYAAAEAFVRHRHWIPLMEFIRQDIQSSWILYLLVSLATALILALQQRVKVIISRLSAVTQNPFNSGIQETITALILTLVVVTARPLLLWFLGWRFAQSSLNLGVAIGGALQFSSILFWLLNAFRGICRLNGVAQTFMNWPEAVVRKLHNVASVYLHMGVPLGFVVVVARELDDGVSSDTVGRVAFVSFCVILSWIMRSVLKPDGALLGNVLRMYSDSLLYRLRWIWCSTAVLTPISLAVLALLGYEYTAEQLMIRFELTLGLSVLLIMMYSTLLQGVLAAKRSLMLKQMRERRQAELAAAERDADAEGSEGSPLAVADTQQVDLTLLNQQVQRLLKGVIGTLFLTGCWAIWVQVLPALQVFGRYELWTTVLTTTESVVSETDVDNPVFREVSRISAITLGHLLTAVFILIVTLVAGRNLPGLLELSLLQKLPLDHGSRNAIRTLSGYVLTVAGVIIASNTIGVRWQSVQWLVAALTVGLGFGLQEIFANFVSGLIILFERPVRVGDIVTIDGVSGAVSRIQIRATTIMDWDRKEFIVPNKEFVTGKLLNWTLTDKINRIQIAVGVAYGSDVSRALELMVRIAQEHPIIMDDPGPVSSFESFGDSTLNLVLRAFVPSLENRLRVVTYLHSEINRQFQEAGIEISFPQRDLHIRTLPASLAESLKAATAGTVPSTVPPEIGAENVT